MRFVLLIITASILLVVNPIEGGNPASTAVQHMQYLEPFLSQVPEKIDDEQLSSCAEKVIIAKAHILDGPHYLIGRDQSGRPPVPPKDLYSVRIDIISVLSGRAPSRERVLDAYFGAPGPGKRYIFPRIPDELALQYFAALCRGSDGRFRLLAFPASSERFHEWERKLREYEPARGKPGARD